MTTSTITATSFCPDLLEKFVDEFTGFLNFTEREIREAVTLLLTFEGERQQMSPCVRKYWVRSIPGFEDLLWEDRRVAKCVSAIRWAELNKLCMNIWAGTIAPVDIGVIARIYRGLSYEELEDLMYASELEHWGHGGKVATLPRLYAAHVLGGDMPLPPQIVRAICGTSHHLEVAGEGKVKVFSAIARRSIIERLVDGVEDPANLERLYKMIEVPSIQWMGVWFPASGAVHDGRPLISQGLRPYGGKIAAPQVVKDFFEKKCKGYLREESRRLFK